MTPLQLISWPTRARESNRRVLSSVNLMSLMATIREVRKGIRSSKRTTAGVAVTAAGYASDRWHRPRRELLACTINGANVDACIPPILRQAGLAVALTDALALACSVALALALELALVRQAPAAGG